MDLVEVLVPTPLHCDVACAVLEAGYHVNLQKPIARTMDEVDRILAARNKSGATLRIMEDYLFFEPLVRLKEITESGEIGRPASLHIKWWQQDGAPGTFHHRVGRGSCSRCAMGSHCSCSTTVGTNSPSHI